jgi:hypothetical protein
MPERAEIEAATDALLEDSGLPRYGAHRNTVERRVRIALEAADRVRDARDDYSYSAERGRLLDDIGRLSAPSRDGTVAVEDVVAAARAFVESWWEFDGIPPQDHYNAVAERVQALDDALAEFGPARAGESNEGGNQ